MLRHSTPHSRNSGRLTIPHRASYRRPDVSVPSSGHGLPGLVSSVPTERRDRLAAPTRATRRRRTLTPRCARWLGGCGKRRRTQSEVVILLFASPSDWPEFRREKPLIRIIFPGLRWLREQDLNLQPSGCVSRTNSLDKQDQLGTVVDTSKILQWFFSNSSFPQTRAIDLTLPYSFPLW